MGMDSGARITLNRRMSTAEDAPLVFGGVPAIPAAEAFEEAQRSQPAWYRALEAAYADFAGRPENHGQYADPAGKGATIPQISRLFQLFGNKPFCVLARPLPSAQTEGVGRLERRTAEQLLGALARLAFEDGEINVTFLHHDGKTGHCIRLTNHDAASDRFEYHDPWPARSLLCEENNQRGVKAQPHGKRWTVTSEELARVAVAGFVFPAYWWRAEGKAPFAVTDRDLRASDFFAHFHLRDQGGEAHGSVIRRVYTPGPFGKWIDIVTDVRPEGRISAARMIASSAWVKQHLELAIDLVRSFIVMFAPPEEPVFKEIAAAIFSLVRDPVTAIALRDADPNGSDVVACVHAFAGSVPKATASTEIASLEIGRVERDGVRYLGLEMTIY